ncbi:hypothetical protein DM45_1408 [Burkholderia mallei]|nr:hypothetical protein DM45_1408 [Burkholderia mallei]KOT06197.1 hypothetical protein DM77_676 [Burkholderia mallei]
MCAGVVGAHNGIETGERIRELKPARRAGAGGMPAGRSGAPADAKRFLQEDFCERDARRFGGCGTPRVQAHTGHAAPHDTRAIVVPSASIFWPSDAGG